MINYHEILKEILKSFVETQNSGILKWKLEYPNCETYEVNLVFPLCLCIVDIKGAHSLCGMYDAYSKIYRPCVSCNCPEEQLDNPSYTCSPVEDSIMRKSLKENSDEELKILSQHRVINNAFFNVDTGGWKYGIWGLCPAEILHQFYEGLISYTLDFFFEKMFTEKSKQALNDDIHVIMNACKNQSDRTFPQASFVMGISHPSKMKGTEKFAAIFYLCLYLHTTKSKSLYEGCTLQHNNATMKRWRKLFEKILFYKEWLMQESFSRSEVKEKHLKVCEFFKEFKSLVKRTEGSGLKIPKVHELLHCCRDILRHGPPRGYDTCPTESNHRPIKNLSQNTQRIKSKLEIQTANRIFEDSVIRAAWNASYDKLSPSMKINQKTTKNETQTQQGIFRMGYDIMDSKPKQISFFTFTNECLEEKIINDNFTSDLKVFLHEAIFSRLSDNTKYVPCYTTHKRDGFLFYGFSRDSRNSRSNPSWAEITWENDDGSHFYCPGKCIMFVDLRNVLYKNDSQPFFPKDVHVIIQSFASNPVQDLRNPSLVTMSKLESGTKFHCVSVDCIHGPAFVIPDLGNTNQVLYVHPKIMWSSYF